METTRQAGYRKTVQSNMKRIAEINARIVEFQEEIDELIEYVGWAKRSLYFVALPIAIYDRIESLSSLINSVCYEKRNSMPYSTEINNFESLKEDPELYTEEEATRFMNELQTFLENWGNE